MNRRRGGMAMLLAVMLIALVGVAVAALSAQLSTSARQTRDLRERAQAEQLLLDGVRIARQAAGDREIVLPEELKGAGATLRLNKGAIEAQVGSTMLRQALP